MRLHDTTSYNTAIFRDNQNLLVVLYGYMTWSKNVLRNTAKEFSGI